MPHRGITTAKLDIESPIGDGMLSLGVIGANDLKRMAEWMREYGPPHLSSLATDFEVAAERDFHRYISQHRIARGWEPRRWTTWPRDPHYPNSDSLPPEVFNDEEFDPHCDWCRKRYRLDG